MEKLVIEVDNYRKRQNSYPFSKTKGEKSQKNWRMQHFNHNLRHGRNEESCLKQIFTLIPKNFMGSLHRGLGS
jgi:hypothetical protein